MLDMKIVYQDAELVVLDKPSGLLSVPGRGPLKQDCVVHRTKQRFPEIIVQPAVHRLDMYTSGLIILAKTTQAHKHLSSQFEKRLVKKKYIAVVEGVVHQKYGEIRLSFRLDPDNRPYQVYDPIQGKLGITRWHRLHVENGKTRIEFKPLTGRTHQLRLHSAHPKGLGAPIVGDRLYGNGNEGDIMQLHACELQFHHPKRNHVMKVISEPPF